MLRYIEKMADNRPVQMKLNKILLLYSYSNLLGGKKGKERKKDTKRKEKTLEIHRTSLNTSK